MTGITVENLKKMSVSKLQEVIATLEGEELNIAKTVLAKKLERNEQIMEIPEVAAEVEIAQEIAGAKTGVTLEELAAKRIELRELAEAEKNAAKERILAEKEKLQVERDKIKELALLEKEKTIVMREEAKKAVYDKKQELMEASLIAKQEALQAKIEAAEVKNIEKAEKAALKLEIAQAKILAKEQGLILTAEQQVEEDARVERVREALRENPDVAVAELSGNKTKIVAELMKLGLTNKEMSEYSGFTNKFICDTTWRLKRQAEAEQWLVNHRAKIAAEKAAAATAAIEAI